MSDVSSQAVSTQAVSTQAVSTQAVSTQARGVPAGVGPASGQPVRGSPRQVAGRDGGVAGAGVSFVGVLAATMVPASGPGAAGNPADPAVAPTTPVSSLADPVPGPVPAPVAAGGQMAQPGPLPPDGGAGGKPRGQGGRAAPGVASAGAALSVIAPTPVDISFSAGARALPAAPADPNVPPANAAIAGPGREAGRPPPRIAGPEAASAERTSAERDLRALSAPVLPPATDFPAIPPAGLALPAPDITPSGLSFSAPPVSLSPVSLSPVSGHATDPGSANAEPAAPAIHSQIAPALVSLSGGPPGTQRLTLRLDPASLGHVQIRIDRAKDAPPEVRITAERPETLALLQRDQHQLHRALDLAGIAAEGRQLTFHSAVPPAEGTGASPTGQSSFGAAFGAGGDTGGFGPGGFGRNRSPPGWDGDGGVLADDSIVPAGLRWMRVGIDITA